MANPRRGFLSLFLLVATGLLFAQDLSDLSFSLTSGVDIPVGDRSALFDGVGNYRLGVGGALRGQYALADGSYVGGTVRYGLHPTFASPLSLLSFGPVGGASFRLGDFLGLHVGGELGLSLGFFEDAEAAANPYAGANAHVTWDLTPGLTLAAGTEYRYHLGYDAEADQFGDLYQAMSVWAGTVFKLRGPGGSKVRARDIRFDPVFPVFYGYYDQNPVGSVVIENNESSTITDVEVSFFVNQYMEQPKLSATIPSIRRGERVEVELNALFTNAVLELTEGTRVSSEIITEYTYLGERFESREPYTLRIHDRNSMTWDDDRKAACFVTAKDPTAQIFAKNTAGIVRDAGNNPINLNLRIAMGMFEALRIYGMNYVVDPQSAYAVASQDGQFVDYLQFPSQSLTFRAGDCDDLSILYSSMLEAAGIPTAFITIPGHIYMAFSLGLTEEEARREFEYLDDFLFIDGDTWVPVEVTVVRDGFLKAWKIGARQWREASQDDSLAFYPIQEAWSLYEPVSISSTPLSLVFPSSDDILAGYDDRLELFIRREIDGEIERLTQRISRRGDSPRNRNQMGVVYAKYGLFREATEQFERALDQDSRYTAAMINLGNIAYLVEDMETALRWYQRAERIDPENPTAVLGIARVQYELERFDIVEREFERLSSLSPGIASRYDYLVTESSVVGRASAALDRGRTLWEDEEE